MTRPIATLLAMVLLAGAAPARQAQPSAPPPSPRGAPAAASLPVTQALFDGYVRSGKMPGIVGAFGVGDAPTVFPAAGRIGDEPGAAVAGPDSLWRVYSMTKPVTALAAMMLIEQGKIGLDDPLSKYFPAFATMRVLVDPDRSLASRPATRPITIRELLTHTAGLGYSIVNKGPLVQAYERAGILPFTTNAAIEAKARPTRPATLDAFAERVATLPLLAEPGTTWSYSIGLDVMGAVIERASGEPFDRYVTRHIFQPLGMRSSYWQVPAGAADRLATNYAIVGSQRVPLDPGRTSVFLQPPSFAYGGAGLVMSARDYDRFLHLLQDLGTLDGVTLLRPATARLMMSNLLPAGVTMSGIGPVALPPGAVGFGAGGFVLLRDLPGGAAAGTYGWSGAAGTQAWVSAGRHIRATVMVNYMPGEQWPVRAETIAALARDAAQAGAR